MTSMTRAAPAVRDESRLPMVLAGVAATASLAAAVSGGSVARLTLAIALPVAVGAWIHRLRDSRPPALVLVVLALLGVAGTLHVAFTGPAAAWIVDSHMAPPVLSALLPNADVRLAVAWTVPLVWAAAFVATAVAAHRRAGTGVGGLLLLGAGAAPLVVGNAFPTDGYRLLWDSTALGHPTYAAGACAIFLVTVLSRDRASHRSAADEQSY